MKCVQHNWLFQNRIKIFESKCSSTEVLLKWKCSSLQNSRQHWTTLPNVNWSYLHLETIKSRSAWKKLGFYWNFSSKVEGGNLLDQERYCASKFVDHWFISCCLSNSLVIYPLEWRHFFDWRHSVENGAILVSKFH